MQIPAFEGEPPMTLRNDRSVNKDFVRALKLTAAIKEDPRHTLPLAFDAVAAEREETTALLSERGNFTFGELAARSLRYARWARSEGLVKGDAVALMMEGRPDYIAAWLGLTRIGVVVALINHHLTGAALAHCVRIASARIVISSLRYRDACEEIGPHCGGVRVVVCDASFEQSLSTLSGEPLTFGDDAAPTLADRALYIYTSGTTGLPKAAIVTHGRVMNWARWFQGLVDVTPGDRMYDCLPLYHSVGGVVAVWSTLLGGGSVVLRERFSARAFWPDVVTHRCTLFQYIGELCRYLAHSPPCEEESRHVLRMAIGNGLRPEVWPLFQKRFAIPRILEFYAATESNFSLYNVEGEIGAIGRIPSFLAARQSVRLIRYDLETDTPLRGPNGFCIPCATDEPGEAIAPIENNFDGYLDRVASEKKILRNVFVKGDAWMRSGDLMRKDARGFYYFVDRAGDSFRWKGENVSTAEVAQQIAAYPGVLDAAVYGVAAPGCEGRAGMAAIAIGEGFDIGGLYAHLAARLPAYARPLFLRLSHGLDVTETFKHRKRELVEAGFDPGAIPDPVFFASHAQAIYVELDPALYGRIVSGDVPL